LTSLVKKIDEAAAKHKDAKMGTFVVFCTDNKAIEKAVKDLAARQHIDHTILAVFDKPAGPPKYKLASDADITVLLYNHKKVKANFAFRKGELNDADVERIVSEIPKIMPEPKEKAGQK
jgi:hypothetical protein